jgi:hypothetical protein
MVFLDRKYSVSTGSNPPTNQKHGDRESRTGYWVTKTDRCFHRRIVFIFEARRLVTAERASAVVTSRHVGSLFREETAELDGRLNPQHR